MNKTIRKVLITGATGFLGAHVLRSFIGAGLEVIGTKRSSSDTWRLEGVMDQINLMDMDMCGPESIKGVIDFCIPDLIIHCAAYGVDYGEQDPCLMFTTNVAGPFTLLEAGARRGVKRFVHIGSCFEYGDRDHPVRENEPLEPTGLYGATKASAAVLMLNAARVFNIELTVLRPFGLWGPMEGPHRLVPQVVDACLENKPLDLTGCEQIRDYTYAPDMADIITTIALHDNFPSNSIINLGSGVPVTLRDLVLLVAGQLGGEALMRFGNLPYRPTEMWQLVADVSRQQVLLPGFKTTPFSEGIEGVVRERKLRKQGRS